MKYNLTFLTTEGWKRHKIETDLSPKEIEKYLESDYVKKVHVEQASGYGYLPLEDVVSPNPRYKIPSDRQLNYFKTTRDTWIDAECAAVKADWELSQAQKNKAKSQVEKMLFGKPMKKRQKDWQEQVIGSFYYGRSR